MKEKNINNKVLLITSSKVLDGMDLTTKANFVKEYNKFNGPRIISIESNKSIDEITKLSKEIGTKVIFGKPSEFDSMFLTKEKPMLPITKDDIVLVNEDASIKIKNYKGGINE